MFALSSFFLLFFGSFKPNPMGPGVLAWGILHSYILFGASSEVVPRGPQRRMSWSPRFVSSHD